MRLKYYGKCGQDNQPLSHIRFHGVDSLEKQVVGLKLDYSGGNLRLWDDATSSVNAWL